MYGANIQRKEWIEEFYQSMRGVRAGLHNDYRKYFDLIWTFNKKGRGFGVSVGTILVEYAELSERLPPQPGFSSWRNPQVKRYFKLRRFYGRPDAGLQPP